MPQGREIFARLTVEENLRMGLAYTSRRQRRSRPSCSSCSPCSSRCWAAAAATCRAASSSNWRLRARSRAEPKLLVLDEPTEGIQPSIIKDIGRVIRMLADRGDMAILLVEQYYDFARNWPTTTW